MINGTMDRALAEIWRLLNEISTPPVGTKVFPLQRGYKNESLGFNDPEPRAEGGEANLQSPHTRRWCSASLLPPPTHKLLPRFLPVGCGSARTTMLLRAAQTRPSRAGVHAATSRLPRRSGTNSARDSLPLIKTTGSTLRSDVSIPGFRR